MSVIVDKIRSRRKQKKILQSEVATLLSISRQSYLLREKKKVDFSIGELEVLCDYLDIRVFLIDTEHLN